MSNTLTIVNAEPPAPAPKKTREKIVLIETQPETDWFVPTKTKRGRRVWYLRLKVTGWCPRLYGPFPSKRGGLIFLDKVLAEILQPLADVEGEAEELSVQEEFAHHWPPLVEHPLCRQATKV